MPRHLTDREAARQLLRTLLTGSAQLSLLPLDHLSPKMLAYLQAYAREEGYLLSFERQAGPPALRLEALRPEGSAPPR